MKKTVVAFDIGESYLKITQQTKNGISIQAVQMPENLMSEGIVQMPHMLSDFLKDVKKQYNLPSGICGMVVPDELTVCRSVVLPAMTEAQLEVNLPFEFSDYISGEPQKYVYDYALNEMIYDEDGKPVEMHLTGAVMSKESVSSYVHIFADAGFKLRTLIPQEIAVANIMKQGIADGRIQADKEYCIINLGHRSTQIYVFHGDKQLVYRNIHVGGSSIDQVIAENENVDVFVARTRKNTNFNNVLETESVRETYARIAVEVRKVINFYRFNNRESMLEDVYFAGGCSNITELCDTIAEINDLQQKPMTDILPSSVGADTDMMGAFAIGVLLQ